MDETLREQVAKLIRRSRDGTALMSEARSFEQADAILALPALAERAAAERVGAPNAGLVAFAKDMIAIAREGGEADSVQIQDCAVKRGLLREESYDPSVHGQIEDVASGDAVFIYAGPLAARVQHPEDGR